MQTFYLYRKWIGILALCCGILTGLSAFMFVPYEIGLCHRFDSNCRESYEDTGGGIFVVASIVSILGSLVFAHTRKGRRPWRISIIVLVLVAFLSLLENILSGGGGFGLPTIPVFFGLAVILSIGYGAYILGLMLKELFEENFLLKNIRIRTLSVVFLAVALGVWILVGFWL